MVRLLGMISHMVVCSSGPFDAAGAQAMDRGGASTHCNCGAGFGPTLFPLLPTHRHSCHSVHMYSISTRSILASHQEEYDVAGSTPAPQTPGTSPHCDSYQALRLTH